MSYSDLQGRIEKLEHELGNLEFMLKLFIGGDRSVRRKLNDTKQAMVKYLGKESSNDPKYQQLVAEIKGCQSSIDRYKTLIYDTQLAMKAKKSEIERIKKQRGWIADKRWKTAIEFAVKTLRCQKAPKIEITWGKPVPNWKGETLSKEQVDAHWHFKQGEQKKGDGKNVMTVLFELRPDFRGGIFRGYTWISVEKYDVPQRVSGPMPWEKGRYFLIKGRSGCWQMNYATSDQLTERYSVELGGPRRMDIKNSIFDGNGSFIGGDEFPIGETTEDPTTSLTWCHQWTLIGSTEVTITKIPSSSH